MRIAPGSAQVHRHEDAVAAAKAAKLDWEEKSIDLVPQAKLVNLVRLSQLEATKEEAKDVK